MAVHSRQPPRRFGFGTRALAVQLTPRTLGGWWNTSLVRTGEGTQVGSLLDRKPLLNLVSDSPLPPSVMSSHGTVLRFLDAKRFRFDIRNVGMRRIAVFLLMATLTGCPAYDWWYKREFRQITDKLRQIPNVTVVNAGGNEDVTFEDIFAELRIDGHATLALTQLTSDAFDGGAPFYVSRVGNLEPRVTSFGFQGVFETATGKPVKSVSFGSAIAAGDNELAHSVCCARYQTVPQAISAWKSLEAELADWPRCPGFREVVGASGTIYRYCTGSPGDREYPQPRPEWSAF